MDALVILGLFAIIVLLAIIAIRQPEQRLPQKSKSCGCSADNSNSNSKQTKRVKKYSKNKINPPSM